MTSAGQYNTWDYRDTTWNESDLVGFDVEATDGNIGTIDDKTNEASGSYVVVDTGFWIFGKKRLIPAGSISRVDMDRRCVYLDLTKDQVKDAPDFEADRRFDDTHRADYDSYYGGLG